MRRAVLAVVCVASSLSVGVLAESNSHQEFVTAMHNKPNLDRGAELFRTCAACHGPLGVGALDGSVPRIGGQHFSVVVKQLVDYRHGQRWDPRMETLAGKHHLPDAQAIADVAAYVNQLESSMEPGVGTGELVEHGASVYAQSCRSCHGPSGEGDPKRLIPQIAGQHFAYLERQIYDAVDGRRPNFSRAHVRLLARLERDDIVGLADYLSRTVRHNYPQPNFVAAAK